MKPLTPPPTPSYRFAARDRAKKPAMLLTLAVLLPAMSCFGWSVSAPYSDADPLVLTPGTVGQFSLVVAQTPFETPSPVTGFIPPECAWFAFGGDGIGGQVTTLFMMPGATEQVDVDFDAPAGTAPGVYDFVYEFTRVDDGSIILGGFPVVVEGSTANVAPAPVVTSCGAYEIGIEHVALEGYVEDADGDLVDYTWLLDGVPVASATADTLPGGGVAALPPVPMSLDLGTYDIALVASDGFSDPVETGCLLTVQDTTPPELDPVVEPAAFRPSNKWRPVTILAQAVDNSGGAVQLDVSVTISGFTPTAKGPRFEPDAYVESIDQAAGVVTLMVLPYGRKKTGYPTFDVEVTAADAAGNSASTVITISVAR